MAVQLMKICLVWERLLKMCDHYVPAGAAHYCGDGSGLDGASVGYAAMGNLEQATYAPGVNC